MKTVRIIVVVAALACTAALPTLSSAAAGDSDLVAEWRYERRELMSELVLSWLRGAPADEQAEGVIDFIRLSVNIASVSKKADAYLDGVESYEELPLQLLLAAMKEDAVDTRSASFFEGRRFKVYVSDEPEPRGVVDSGEPDTGEEYSSHPGGFGGGASR